MGIVRLINAVIDRHGGFVDMEMNGHQVRVSWPSTMGADGAVAAIERGQRRLKNMNKSSSKTS